MFSSSSFPFARSSLFSMLHHFVVSFVLFRMSFSAFRSCLVFRLLSRASSASCSQTQSSHRQRQTKRKCLWVMATRNPTMNTFSARDKKRARLAKTKRYTMINYARDDIFKDVDEPKKETANEREKSVFRCPRARAFFFAFNCPSCRFAFDTFCLSCCFFFLWSFFAVERSFAFVPWRFHIAIRWTTFDNNSC